MNKERPILFSGQMVQAIFDDRKTLTRRVVKPQPVYDGTFRDGWAIKTKYRNICPYGQIGDRLWVRETFKVIAYDGDKRNRLIIEYRDGKNAEVIVSRLVHDKYYDSENERLYKWRPSIFMPRWASRITLEITNIRVERLQEITITDAVKEGMDDLKAVLGFANLWDSINGKKYPWSSNPWVWVIEFKNIRGA